MQKSKNSCQERIDELEKKLSESTDSNHAMKIALQKSEREKESMGDDLKLLELKLKKILAEKESVQSLYQENLAKRSGLAVFERTEKNTRKTQQEKGLDSDVEDAVTQI